MYRFLLAGLLLVSGCCEIMGPRQRAVAPRVIDSPCLPLREQEVRGRDQLAYPIETQNVGPRTWAEVPAEGYQRTSH